MDKEQAIELLEHLAWDKDNEGNCYGEALQMAIDALKQPEIITCGECVNFAERDFCKVAGHNVHRKSNCMQVFGAERRTDADD